MDTASQPTDDTLPLDPVDALLERARLFILDLMVFVEGVFHRLGDVPVSAKLARHLTRYALVPAETALRRAILILAAELTVPVLRAPSAARSHAPAAPSQGAPAREAPPRFSMYEPPPRAASTSRLETEYLSEDGLPRILAFTDDVLYAPASPPPPVAAAPDAAARFTRRFAALQAAFQDAQGEAQRWARRRVRALARCAETVAEKVKALAAPLFVPRLRNSLKPGEKLLLRELTETTNAAFGHNTS